ncbi:MAG: hypothetical protein KDA45_09740 [Planctomycetales bacterium]|nr:hypothetical protein [Planctomycetales bacterium]
MYCPRERTSASAQSADRLPPTAYGPLRLLLLITLLLLAQPTAAAAQTRDRPKPPGQKTAQTEPSAKTTQPAEKSPTEKSPAEEPSTEESPAEESQLAEERVLDFVGEHQPDLLKLLQFLKTQQPAKYQLALRDTSRSLQKLERLAQRDAGLHALELDLWRTQTQLRLLAAEMSAAATSAKISQEKNAEREQRLEKLVQQQLAQELAKLKLLRARAAKAVTRLDGRIAELSTGEEEQVSKSLKSWRSRISRQARVPQTISHEEN